MQLPPDATAAARVLTSRGWLAAQPEDFQRLVLAHASVQSYRAGDVVYRFGDDPGGIYGVVSGAYKATTAPPRSTPRLLHVGLPGSWVGEGCYLVRERRRVGVSAPVDSVLVHVPLQAMDEITARDAAATRRFTQILMGNVDTLVRAFYDLQHPRAECRVALALLRIAGADGDAVPLSQEELGVMSNTVRRQVNAALQRFVGEGWVRTAYRATVVTDTAALQRYVADES